MLVLPGLYDSGPEHWQSLWERDDPAFERVLQDDWESPRCADWCVRLEEAVARRREAVVLCCHSSSCALVAHWAGQVPGASLTRIHGAFLAAPSDPEGPAYPTGPTGFAPMPLRPLPFPSIVVASTDDIYVTAERAREYAERWGSRYVVVGAAGHINSASGLGEWPAGRTLLDSLR